MGICKETLLPVSCCSQLSKLDESCVRGFLLITRTKDPEPILNCVLLYLIHRLKSTYGTSTVGFKIKNISYKNILLDFVFPRLQLYQLLKLNRCIQDGKIKKRTFHRHVMENVQLFLKIKQIKHYVDIYLIHVK